jgi:CheY-like chemotaxis protein
VEERLTLCRTIRSSSDRLLGVVEDVLDYARIEGGSVELESEAFDLHDAIRRGTDALRSLAKQRGARLSVTLPHGARRALGDESRLRQMVDRLVESAITLSGGAAVEVELLTERQGDSVELELKIEASCGPHREHDCRRFVEALSADDESKSTGPINLGASIAERLAEMMKASLSAGFEGSVLMMRLAMSLPAAEPDRSSGDTIQIGPHRLHSLRVLVVEDGPDNRLLLRMLLEKAGATVEVATNGREALEMAGPLKPHVILMDLQMPVMDGFEATRRLRERGHRGPIIAVTANASEEDRRRCELAGFDFFLSKPVNRGELYERCASMGRAS